MKTTVATKPSVYTIVDTVSTPSTLKDARLFGAALAADRGYTSKIVKVAGGHDCVASDGRAVRFLAQ